MNDNIKELKWQRGIPEQWETLKKVAYDTAEEVLGRPQRKHLDWFSEDDKRLNCLKKEI